MPFTAEPIHGECINYLPCLIDFSSTHLFFYQTGIIENKFGKTYGNENMKTKLEEKKYKKDCSLNIKMVQIHAQN